MSDDQYLRTDEQLDVLISLRETLHQVGRTDADPHCWKWAIIALVSAVNGALICNLTGTMQVGALRKSDRKAMIVALQEARDSYGLRSELPEVLLETPLRLLDMAANHHRFDPGSGPRLPISEEQRNAFQWLLGLRNGFMHFQPQSWSIAISDLRPTFLQVVEILRAVKVDGHSFRHLNECDQEEIDSSITLLEKKLTSFP